VPQILHSSKSEISGYQFRADRAEMRVVALYLNETFHASLSENSTKFAPLFRVLPAATFLEHFYSDRMHMFDRKNQTWSSPPPNYECILNG